MLVRTRKLSGIALDWIVAKTEDKTITLSRFREGRDSPEGLYRYSEDWALTGPILERDKTELRWEIRDETGAGQWIAQNLLTDQYGHASSIALYAILHCHVAAYFGDEVEVPDELAVE